MNNLSNKNILLGISAGIAAYKSCELVRLLIKEGASVQVVMTKNAQQFISPMTFQSLSAKPVRIEMFDKDAEAGMSHIELARWADIFIIAPASADIIAKISHGFADNLLSTLWLASNAQKFIAPAMNKHMWYSPATCQNIEQLKKFKINIVGPNNGEQACGDIGFGRMSEPNEILQFLMEKITALPQQQSLSSLKVMVTAGPTIEDIDPVRFISNYSSGKMGYAIAQAAMDAGAQVHLITGPTHIDTPSCTVHSVKTAQQMQQKVMSNIQDIDIFIGCAAVADYRVAETQNKKIKKTDATLTLELKQNPDIIKQVAEFSLKNKKNKPYCVAFAAETDTLEKHAKQKLYSKGVHLIAANWVGHSEKGENLAFNQDENELFLFWDKGEKHLEKSSKKRLAQQLIEQVSQLI